MKPNKTIGPTIKRAKKEKNKKGVKMTKALPPEMKEKYEKAKELIENSEDIKIYSHTDCDGISSGAILSSILDRLGKRYEIEIVNL